MRTNYYLQEQEEVVYYYAVGYYEKNGDLTTIDRFNSRQEAIDFKKELEEQDLAADLSKT